VKFNFHNDKQSCSKQSKKTTVKTCVCVYKTENNYVKSDQSLNLLRF